MKVIDENGMTTAKTIQNSLLFSQSASTKSRLAKSWFDKERCFMFIGREVEIEFLEDETRRIGDG